MGGVAAPDRHGEPSGQGQEERGLLQRCSFKDARMPSHERAHGAMVAYALPCCAFQVHPQPQLEVWQIPLRQELSSLNAH